MSNKMASEKLEEKKLNYTVNHSSSTSLILMKKSIVRVSRQAASREEYWWVVMTALRYTLWLNSLQNRINVTSVQCGNTSPLAFTIYQHVRASISCVRIYWKKKKGRSPNMA
jgi:hypothetical protein